MTRYRVELEIAVQDGSELSEDRFARDLDLITAANVPAQSGWALTKKPKFTEVDTTPWTHKRSKWADDARWTAILKWVEDKVATGQYVMSSRHAPMEGETGGTVYCKVSFYRKTSERTLSDERFVFLVGAQVDTRGPSKGQVTIKVDGPYVDNGEAYWIDMADRDAREGDHIITEDWHHYTVHKDSRVPGQGDGFGGSEFRFLIESPTMASRLQELGLDVRQSRLNYKEGDQIKWILTTRNLWSQSVIPAAMRYLFKPNVQDIGSVKAIAPNDLEATLFPENVHPINPDDLRH